MHDKLENKYRSELESQIIDLSLSGKEKDKIKSVVNLYCSNLINDGFSRQYILKQVNDRFFSDPIKKVEKRTLQRFFSGFDGKERKLMVIIPISKNLSSYISRLSIKSFNVKELKDLPKGAEEALVGDKRHKATDKYFTIHVNAKDEFAALKTANEVISSLIAMTYLAKRGVNFDWSRYGYVKGVRSSTGFIAENEQIVFQTQSPALTNKVIKELKSQTEQIIGEFSGESTDRLLSAINISALSRSSPRPENQLIMLWSAIEVLLSDPPRGVARVSHYVDALTPCICIKYVRRYIIAVFDELRVHYSKHMREFFRKDEFDQGVDQYTNFSYLIYREDLKKLHEPFCEPFVNNPLALFRLWKLEKNFGTPEALLRSLSDHENRVRWQLHRIYRTRNSIVHSGNIPTFLEPLVMNVFEYFRGSTGPIFGRATSVGHEASIDQIVAEIGFDYTMLKDTLHNMNNNNSFSSSDIDKLHR